MDETRFTEPVDSVGAFSKSVWFGRFECYRHLQGDNMFVAENATNGRREFFRTAQDLKTWVEAQPRFVRALRSDDYHTWRNSR